MDEPTVLPDQPNTVPAEQQPQFSPQMDHNPSMPMDPVTRDPGDIFYNDVPNMKDVFYAQGPFGTGYQSTDNSFAGLLTLPQMLDDTPTPIAKSIGMVRDTIQSMPAETFTQHLQAIARNALAGTMRDYIKDVQ